MFFYLLIILIVLYNVYLHIRRKRLYYDQGLKGPFCWPIIGNFPYVITKPFAEYDKQNFEKYGRTFVDLIIDHNGVITTSDPDLVKKILISDFSNFYHRFQPLYMHKYSREAVIFQNKNWKRIRSQITPVFTSGRLRIMFKNFQKPIDQCLNNIKELIDQNKGDQVDTRRLMKSFALDIIANVVFSLQTNAFKEDSEFAKKVDDLFSLDTFSILLLIALPDSLQKLFGVTFLRKGPSQYFAKLALNIIEQRKNNRNKDIVYNDFIEMLLKSEAEGEVEKNNDDQNKKKVLTLEEIVGQCFIFFVAGQETISTALALLLYELAVNQDVQDKLYKDLITNYPSDEISYDDLNKSFYLDCVLNESLRKHTTLTRVFRQAVSDYDFGNFKVKKGQTMGISIGNLHMDPAIFEEPQKFKPERFETNQYEHLFIPFVDGPRNCIGYRYSLVMMKEVLIKLVKNYRVFATSRTQIPPKSENATIINLVKDVTLGYELRNSNSN